MIRNIGADELGLQERWGRLLYILRCSKMWFGAREPGNGLHATMNSSNFDGEMTYIVGQAIWLGSSFYWLRVPSLEPYILRFSNDDD